MWCFIGTTASPPSDRPSGIHVCRFDPETGDLSSPMLAAATEMPSFLAIHPSGAFVYATREVDDGGGVVAFAVNRATGRLTRLKEQPSGGAGPCFAAVDASGRCLLVANYGGGSATALPLGTDGSLGPPLEPKRNQGKGIVRGRQDAPHLHAIRPDPSNRFALACDLGTDQLLVLRLTPATAALAPHDPPFANLAPGSGPRHLAFHPGSKHVYVVNELSNTVTTFAWDGAGGTLNRLADASTLPSGYTHETYAAEIRVHPAGLFLYVSNRGHDTIAVFAIDPGTAALTAAGHVELGGRCPRHFTIDPTGRWLIAALEQSDEVAVFRVAGGGQHLEAAPSRVRLPSPSCVVLADAG